MSALDLHVTVAAVTIASMLIGALVELLYRPARQRDLDALRAEYQAQCDNFFNEVRELREEMRVRLAVLESKRPPD